jgi:putative endonuclease
VKRKRLPASQRSSTRAVGTRAERRALWHYRLRGYRILATNLWIAGYELDVVARRGGLVVFCEVKAKSSAELGDPLEMVGVEKTRRVRRAAEAWLASNRDLEVREVRFDVAAERKGKLTVVADAF